MVLVSLIEKAKTERATEEKADSLFIQHGIILDAGPVVGPHLQKAADSHTHPDAPTVTQKDVQNHLVPPALSKVGQQMHEEQLRGKVNKAAVRINHITMNHDFYLKADFLRRAQM